MSKVVKNIGYLGFVQIINYIFPLLTVPYVSRIIGPESFGIINYATAFMSYFVLLIGYGFDLTATRRIAQKPDDKLLRNKVYSEILNARLILFICSLFLFLVAIIFVEPLKQNLTVTTLLFFMCLSNVLVPQYIYQGMQNLTIFAKANFIRGFIYTLAIFIFVKKQDDYVYIVTINGLLSLITSLFFLFYAKRIYNLKFILLPLKATLLFLWHEKVIFFSTVVISLYTTTNVVLLGFFDNIKNVAYFTTGQNLVNISTTVLTAPLSVALFPYLGSAFSVSKENGLEVARRILPIIFYIITIGCFILFLLAPTIVNILYGIKFRNSILPMQIMAFSPLIISLSNFFGIQVMLNLNLDKLFFKIIAICSIFGLSLNIYMSTHWGYIGTAYNVIIVESTVTCTIYFLLKKRGIDLISIKNFMPKEIWVYLKAFIIRYRTTS
jgi:PST family polysaccharide transporter